MSTYLVVCATLTASSLLASVAALVFALWRW